MMILAGTEFAIVEMLVDSKVYMAWAFQPLAWHSSHGLRIPALGERTSPATATNTQMVPHTARCKTRKQ